MTYIADVDNIINTLKEPCGLAVLNTTVKRAYPKHIEELPCVTIGEAANYHAVFADNKPTVECLEYDARIFAVRGSELDALAAAVSETLEELGFIRTRSVDMDNWGVDARMKLLGFRRYATRSIARDAINASSGEGEGEK